MDFTSQIKTALEKKGLSPTSIKLYVRNLEKLNGKQPIKDVKFLNKVDNIVKAIEDDYKPNSQRTFFISIVSVLNAIKGESKPLNKLYKTYFDKMIDIANKIREIPTEQKSESQEANWVDWNDVKAMREELQKKHKEHPDDFQTALHLMILSLYTEVPPRRNADYQLMNVVQKYEDKLPNDRNYLSIDSKQFIFNQYKTAKRYGKQVVDIPDSLYSTINDYLRLHPEIQGKITKTTNTPFLVDKAGKPLDKINSLTRQLNRIFGKNVGSSLLRHSFLSGKYGDSLDEMKKDSEMMAHSTQQQKEYIKK
jgi:hypothetical protein